MGKGPGLASQPAFQLLSSGPEAECTWRGRVCQWEALQQGWLLLQPPDGCEWARPGSSFFSGAGALEGRAGGHAVCCVASRAPPNFQRGWLPGPLSPCSPAPPGCPGPSPGPGVPFPEESSDVSRGQRVHPDSPPTAVGSPPHTQWRALESRKQLKAELSPNKTRRSTGPLGPGRLSAPRRGSGTKTRTSGKKAPGARGLGLCQAEGWMARQWPAPRREAWRWPPPGSLPSRQRSPAAPPALSLDSPLARPSDHFPRTLVPPPAQGSRGQGPQARAAPPSESPERRGDGEGLTLFVISPFNPQMGQRLTLFGSGREKALTIICF